jgi:hypothetical protein
MGGVMDVAGLPGFLGNLNELYEASDGDGQLWREFTGAWWDAFRTEPKKVSDLAQFCEERDLMLNVRGDGSARSQQTRLGKALATKRDRVFNGLTVKRINQGKHKGSIFYALAPATSPGGNPPREPDLLDLADGDVAAEDGDVGDLAEKRPHPIGPIEPMTCRQNGDVGDVGDLFPVSSRERNSLSHSCTDTCESGAHVKEGPENVPNVPNVPNASVTETKQGKYVMGTFGANVPMMSPQGPQQGNRDPIDLAKLPETAATEPP